MNKIKTGCDSWGEAMHSFNKRENYLSEIIYNGEDSYTEFKSEKAHNDSIAKEMVAFANTAGGRIYFGIEDNGEITGPIPFLIDSGIKFITSNAQGKSVLKEGEILRRDTLSYYEIIYRELLCNAFQHRDWSIFGQKIKVQMFADRLEIVSPGKLPNTLTIENALVGNSYYRNPLVSQILRDYGLVDKMGRGVFKVLQLCRDWNLPPIQFLETNHSLTVTIPINS